MKVCARWCNITCRNPVLTSLNQPKHGARHLHAMFQFTGLRKRRRAEYNQENKKYVQWYSTTRESPKTQAPAAAAQDSGTSIRQLIKTPWYARRRYRDAPRKVIKIIVLALAGAALVAVVHVDGYRLGEVRVEVLRLFLRKRISCNNCDIEC